MMALKWSRNTLAEVCVCCNASHVKTDNQGFCIRALYNHNIAKTD